MRPVCKRGFTLIEMVIVLTIISILVAALTPVLSTLLRIRAKIAWQYFPL